MSDKFQGLTIACTGKTNVANSDSDSKLNVVPSRSGQPGVAYLAAAYHEQALSQAQVQFWFSVIAATVGFAWILYAGTEIRFENIYSAAKVLPGLVMETAAYLFVRQASETRKRATELYDRLRRDQQLSESITLASSIEDLRIRSAIKAQVALQMSGLKRNPVDLSRLLDPSKTSGTSL